jgi:uncharacterized protein YbbK (DUF523 family)/uncharacterized protein YbgA (DUF1722 family)
MPQPHIVISRCLGFAACRWDQQFIESPLINKLKPFIRFEPVCPEIEIGLGVPRPPIRVVIDRQKFRLIQPETGLDLTPKMDSFARKFIASHQEVDGWILKSRSPSCGLRDTKIFTSGTSSAPLKRGAGLFALWIKQSLSLVPLEDEQRLESPEFLEKFLIRIFTLARFRQAKSSREIRALVNFHHQNRELLQIFGMKNLHLLDKIITFSNQDKLPFLWSEYENHLKKIINSPFRRKTVLKVLRQMIDSYFPFLSPREKDDLENSVHLYLKKKTLLSPLLQILEKAALRHNPDLLENLSLITPYPLHLVTS